MHTSLTSRLALVLIVLSFAGTLVAEKKKQTPKAKPAQKTAQANTTDAKRPPIDPETFKAMKWRQIGPFRGGRALAVEGVPGQANTFYFGGVAGGVWKTVDAGANWAPLGGDDAPVSVGSIAVSPSDPNIIYVGSGEACIRGNITYGDGVYKSLDGGKTWKNLGLRDTRHIGRVIVHPRNPDIVLVAALGHAFGPNAERGLYRTTDGGKNWDKVLWKDDKTGAIDVTFDPSNPNILFAAMWETLRQPWSMSSGGPGSGLYKSTDGGSNWKRLEGNGLPKGLLGRIGVSISGADSSRVYALIEAEDGGLYRSEDGGEKWTKVNDDQRYRQRAWYFSHIFADPKAVDTVYVLNTGLFRSSDGGKTFALLPAPHGDHHGLWIDPNNPNRIINANDGGATISTDGGKTWTTQENQPTAQFYHVVADNRFPYHVYGAQQDNSTIGIASRDYDEFVIGRWNWYSVGGGESGYIAPDRRDPDIIYAGSAGGYLTRYDRHAQQVQDISPWPLDTSGHGTAQLEHRFQWTEPILVSVHDPKVLYTAGETILKSTNQGMSWSAISPDLTRNDKSKQQPSGGPITKDNTGVEYYDTVFTLAESPLRAGVLWAGTDDGLIQISQDDGKNWANVTPKGLPEWSLISLVEASPHEVGTAYAAIDRHRLDDFQPYIYKTSDSGKSWNKIIAGIPDGAYVHAVREDPARKGLLYAGTERGVFVSFNDGAEWQPLQLNLPVTPIHDLVVKDDDLVVATHGRSFWILDDLTPIQQATPQSASAELALYKPRASYRLHYPENVDKRRPVGENPPDGAIINYYLKSAPKDKEEVTLEILDSQGKRVRKFSSLEKKKEEQPPEWPDQIIRDERLPAQAGMNRFAWDLRYEAPPNIPGAFYASSGPIGSLALPGTYQLKLTWAGKSETAPLEIKVDPRVKASSADLQKQFELSRKVSDSIAALHQAVNQVRDLRAQLQVLHKRVNGEKGSAILTASDALDKKMSPVEAQLIQVNMKSSEGNLNFPTTLNEQFDTFSRSVESADAAPTQQQLDLYETLNKRLQQYLSQWREISSNDVAALNKLIQQQEIPPVAVMPMPQQEQRPAPAGKP